MKFRVKSYNSLYEVKMIKVKIENNSIRKYISKISKYAVGRKQ